MKLIDRYIGKTVLSTTILVVLMLTGITIFIALIQEVNDIGTGNYGLLAALEFVFLSLPLQVYTFFPMAMLVGFSLGLGLLANHNELTVMRASGVSLGRIIRAAMKTAILLLIIATLIGEWLGPLAQHFAENQKTILTSKGQALETKHGTWMRDGLNFLYINTIHDHNLLEGISRYQLDNFHNLVKVSYAKQGLFQQDHWIMQDVVESQISLSGIKTQQYPTSTWQLSLNPKLLRISSVDPQEMPFWQLLDYIHYLKQNKQNISSYALAFWQRLLQPLTSLVMVWLAIPFVFGSMRNMTMGLRMVMGITLGFIFYILNQFLGPICVVYQWPPILAALLPTLLFAMAAYVLQRNAH